MLMLYILNIFKTFASMRVLLEKKNESFCFENASNLTHEFLYNNLKLDDEFTRQNDSSTFPPKIRRSEAKVLIKYDTCCFL